MANNKIGFNYYSIDTDRYLDIRIKRLKKEFKCDGIAIYDYILCEIYREKGCFIEWDENTLFDVADYFDVKESLVNNIVHFCCEIGLFNKDLLEKEKALSSLSIQTRYLDWCIKAKRKNVKIPNQIKLHEESSKIHEESPKIIEEPNENAGTLPQSKVKKSKVTKSKESNRKSKSFKDFTEKEFEEEISLYRESFDKDLRRSFFNYWKELSPDGIMRFQLQKTWQTNLRLETWKTNEQKFYHDGSKMRNGQSKNSKSAGAYQLLDDLKEDCGIHS